VAVALVAILALSTQSLARAAPQAPGAQPYGLVGFSANGLPGSSIAERTANYQRLYDAGVRAIRIDLPWIEIQPPGQGGRFDFSQTDREISAIRAAGLKLIGILDYGNPDYSALGHVVALSPLGGGIPPFGVGSAQYFPPDRPADFARYARATAQHYANDAIAWEVWNEENEGYRFWEPHEDPAAYARLLCATYSQVRAVSPGVPVLFGGVFFPGVAGLPGLSGPQFVARAYAAQPGLRDCYDALAYHPYAYPFTSPELDVQLRGSVLSAADQMRNVLRANHDQAKPLWITEVGWPTQLGYGVSETKQAQYVARMEAATFSQGIAVLNWYTYGDGSDPTGPINQEDRFGFFAPDNSPKPAFRALSTFAKVFAGTHFVADHSRQLGLPTGSIDLGGRAFALEYQRPGASITALWLASESLLEGQGPLANGGTFTPSRLVVRLPVSSPSVTLIDYLGSSRMVAAQEGTITVTISDSPQYLADSASPVLRAPRRACPGRAVTVRLPRRWGRAVLVREVRAGRRLLRFHRIRGNSVRVSLLGLRGETVRLRVIARIGRGRRSRTTILRRSYRLCHGR